MEELINRNTVVKVVDDTFSFVLRDPGQTTGWQHLAFGLKNGSEQFISDCTTTKERHRLILQGCYIEAGIDERVCFNFSENGSLIVERELENNSDQSVTISDVFVGKNGEDSGFSIPASLPWHLNFCHMDNLRTETIPRCRPEFPYIRRIPWQETSYGNQENQAIPMIMFFRDDFSTILLEGQLNQVNTRARWDLKTANGGNSVETYRLSWDFHNSGGITLHCGEKLILEPVCYILLRDSDIEKALTLYGGEVELYQHWQTKANPLNHKAFYCTWNYAFFREISEEKLLPVAKFIRDHLPSIEYFLIDGGWVPWENGKGPHLGNFNLPDDQIHDREKFPNGMNAMADKIREIGLKPALHWTPFVRLNTKLANAHPDWFCKDSTGELYRIGNYGYFDFSLPQVQEFFRHVFQTIFKKWGYHAMKMDFWSQSVESNEIRYHQGTGIEWRDWLLSTIHEYLPKDGFLMTCVATAMGNPFLGKYAQTYRACIDVGVADWEHHVTASIWVQPMLPLPEQHNCLLNIDGIGINPELSDDENMHRFLVRWDS